MGYFLWPDQYCPYLCKQQPANLNRLREFGRHKYRFLTACERCGRQPDRNLEPANSSIAWHPFLYFGHGRLGSTNITPGGTITYAPTNGYSGSDQFVVQVSDGTATANMTVNVTVNGLPTVTVNPSNSTICSGANASFGVTATGAGLSYQWQISTNGGSSYSNVSNGGIYTNATTSTLNLTLPTTAVSGDLYRCVVSGTCTPSVNSTGATLTVNTAPSISVNPSNSTICSGSNTSFSVTAAGSGLTYQWQVSINGGSSYSNVSNAGIYSNATTSTLNLVAATSSVNGNLYRCVVSGSCTPTATSTGATLTINALPAVTVNPSNSTICAGSNTSFSVTATGAGTLSYLWQVSTNGGTSYSTVGNGGIYTNATTSTLNITAATTAVNNNLYRCVVSGTCTPSATSAAATLTVNAAPAVTTSPSNSTVCTGANTSFTVTATGQGLLTNGK